ncbi:hypothetical protein DENSPDRAFT_663334 [Dentipellis sp. KUC8613]|nr:hypothetical protein DENSPDRAFT_663334 [Dentipellis sp. KUC8613]
MRADPGTGERRALASVLLASSRDDKETLRSLVKAGILLVQPPEYVHSLLREKPGKCTFLSPGAVASRLRSILAQRGVLMDSKPDLDRILVYLLPTSDLDLERIADLPLFRSTSGQCVSLRRRQDAPTAIYTLLSDDEIDLFGASASVSPPSIALSQISEAVRTVLAVQGPLRLSVDVLGSETAQQYLCTALRMRFNLTLEKMTAGPARRPVVEWLIRFWDWLSSWDSRGTLLGQLSSYPLLPARGDRLVSPVLIFDSHEDLDADEVDALYAFRIFVVHPDVTARARQFLSKQGRLKSLQNHADVLCHLSEPEHGVEESIARALRDHLFSSLRPGQLSGFDRTKLKNLRIYPLLTPGRVTADRSVGSIPPNSNIISVTDMNLLPTVSGVTFLDGCVDVLRVLNGGSSAAHAVMGECDVLALAVDNLVSQSTTLQRAFLKRIVQKRGSLPSGVLHKLGQTAFVRVCGEGGRKAPCAVLDPDCDAAALFRGEDRLPSRVDDGERDIVRCLQSLRLFRSDLGADLVQDRISRISGLWSSEADALARSLLALLVRLNYDMRNVKIERDVRWLPTPGGVRSCRKCHHPDAHPRVLFDRVLPVLDLDTLPPSFKLAFGWDADIPVDVLKQQLVQLAVSGVSELAKQLRPVVREMGRRVRELQDPDIAELRGSLADRAWVPISPYQGVVARTEYAVLSEIAPSDLPSCFYAVPQEFVEEPGVREFLQRMGCQDRPSFPTLMHELQKSSSVDVTISILRSVAELEVKDDLRRQILVPDANGTRRPIDAVLFNDLGDRADMVTLPDNRFLAHGQLDSGLAKRLQLNFLGLSGIEVPSHEEMKEDLTTRISGVLSQYSIEQSFGEFVSNAADAGASKFAVCVDTKEHVLDEDAGTLHPAEFHKCHSLVLYNDAQFRPEDWSGMLRVGRGGKEGRTDTIGQFGLGSLSNFHFTEMPMIVSGDSVLILDPSKSRLPGTGRATVRMSLSQMRSRYPDQLTVLDGMFGFDQKSKFYAGTIFWFPLRTEIQARDSEISKKAITQSMVADLINNLRNDAAGMLFFTRQLRAIEVLHRGADGVISDPDWTYEVTDRTTMPVAAGEECEKQNLRICHQARDATDGVEKWQIFQSSMHHSSLPPEFQPLIKDYRLREPIMTSLAIAPASHRSGLARKFFSSVALPLSTQLPFHINGSFILASDRRSIRFDDGGLGSLESRYNHWLLQSRFPVVYAFALEQLMKTAHTDSKPCRWERFWPEHCTDSLSRTILSGFYDSTFLGQLDRRICCSESRVHQKPRDCLLIDAEDDIASALRYLSPEVLITGKKPSLERRSYRTIKQVHAEYVRDLVERKADAIRQGFRDKRLKVRDLRWLANFLIRDQPPTILDGLLLIPLADGSLAAFQNLDSDSVNDERMLYSWSGTRAERTSEPSRDLIPIDRLVHRDFSKLVAELQGKGLNVSKLTSSYVLKMLQQWLGETPLCRLPFRQDTTHRIRGFWLDWPDFKSAGVSNADISDFPLVPTLEPACFISLSHCRKSSSVVILDQQADMADWILEALGHIGFVFVQRGAAGPALDGLLPDASQRRPTMIRVLQLLKSQPDNVQHILQLSGTVHSEFCTWARNNMPHDDSLSVIGRMLPVWQTLGSPQKYIAASDVQMLPSTILHPHEIVPFLRDSWAFIAYDSKIEHNLKLPPLKLTVLHNRYLSVQIGQQLSSQQLPSYHKLMDVLLNAPGNRTFESVLLPNSAGTLVPAHELYARTVPIFAAAFETQPGRFIHPTYRDQEQRARRFGLHTELDFDSFLLCAGVVNADVHTSRERRAVPLYALYRSEVLAIYIGGDTARWRALDQMRFIPRREARFPPELSALPNFDTAAYSIRDLPNLISPSEILRPGSESVAWSQRGLFASAPNERLLLADLQLGIPTIGEVVEHLRVLARIARDHPGSAPLLAEIKATYAWLSERAGVPSTARALASAFTPASALFLNIDRAADAWAWRSARELFFGIEDADAAGVPVYGVRALLEPCAPLLRAVGVKDGSPLTDYARAAASPAEAQLGALRAAFAALRKERVLLDVVLVPAEGGSLEAPCEAHRVVLAAASGYFRDMFRGAFDDLRRSETKVDASARCIECALGE